ncbi:MAG: T9SS type A sorting domain-containing protein [Bacteroidales bacterium]|jgi:hypothetical protein|nr:T9SS type A sorting domain-containing protein [Bacteroidales bacterium]
MKQLLLIAGFLIAHIYSHAQHLARMYEYDASGNRVVRKTLNIKSASAQDSGGDSTHLEDVQRSYAETIGAFTVSIYPNPTTANVKLEIANYEKLVNGTVSVYSLSGQLLRAFPITSSRLEIDFSPYPAGMYLVRLRLDDYKDEWKIVKQ